MDFSQGLLLFFGILLIALGPLYFYLPFVKWDINKSNAIRGTQSKITKEAITYRKVIGIIMILLGIGLICMGFIVIPQITSTVYSPQ